MLVCIDTSGGEYTDILVETKQTKQKGTEREREREDEKKTG